MPILNEKNRINAGEFIHPIQIQRKTSSGLPNAQGIVESTWETIMSTRAKVMNNTNKESYVNNVTEYSVESKKFYFRTSKQVKLKSNDRILYDGEIYNITSIYDLDDKKIISLALAVLVEG